MGIYRLHIRHQHSYYPCGSGYSSYIGAVYRQHHYHLPVVGWHIYSAARNGIGSAAAATAAACAYTAGYYIKLVAQPKQTAAIVFQIAPGFLIEYRRLR